MRVTYLRSGSETAAVDGNWGDVVYGGGNVFTPSFPARCTSVIAPFTYTRGREFVPHRRHHMLRRNPANAVEFRDSRKRKEREVPLV